MEITTVHDVAVFGQLTFCLSKFVKSPAASVMPLAPSLLCKTVLVSFTAPVSALGLVWLGGKTDGGAASTCCARAKPMITTHARGFRKMRMTNLPLISKMDFELIQERKQEPG